MNRDDLTMTVARNIQVFMERKGMKAPELARRSGLNPTGVYDIIYGRSRSPKIETIGKIAKGLGVPVSFLFDEIPEDDMRSEIISIFLQLPRGEQDRLLLTARAWLGESAPA